MLRRLPDQRCDEAVRSAAGLRGSRVDVNQHAGCQFGDRATPAVDSYPTTSPTGPSCRAPRSIAGSSSTSARAWDPLWNNHRFSRGAATTTAPLTAHHRDLGLPSRAPSEGATATAATTTTRISAATTRARVTGSRANAARPTTCKARWAESAAAKTSTTSPSICRANRGRHEDPDGPLRGSALHGE